MCGIIYSKNLQDNQPVNPLVKLMFLNQKDRGTEGFGFIGLSAERLDLYRATDEKGILSYLNGRPYDEILLHHRLPTSTKNTLQSTHPFIIDYDNRRYYFIHNGIIANPQALKGYHSKKNIVYASLNKDGTFNDSESLAWEFVLYLQGKITEIRAVGSAAFICLETDKRSYLAQRLYFYHNDGSPLKVYRDREFLLLSSAGNWATNIQTNNLYYYDYATRKVISDRALLIPDFTYESWNNTYYDDEFDGWDIQQVHNQIINLEMERDYLVSVGEYEQAETLDDDIQALIEML